MTISRSAWRGVKRGSNAPNRSMSYGDIESDMYSIAQHAVANGYGKIENLRAHPIALSRRVRTAVSPSRISSPPCASPSICLSSAIDDVPLAYASMVSTASMRGQQFLMNGRLRIEPGYCRTSELHGLDNICIR